MRSRHIQKSDDEMKEFYKQRVEERSKLSLAFQLGYYVGEEIVHRYLPTLSCDMMQTNKVISVTAGEGDECRRLNKVWYEKRTSFRGNDDEGAKESEAEWNAVRAYHEMLEDKYLKPIIECRFTLLNVRAEDMEEFKKGLGTSIWDCDCSHYSSKAENIEIEADDEGMFTTITLKRVKGE